MFKYIVYFLPLTIRRDATWRDSRGHCRTACPAAAAADTCSRARRPCYRRPWPPRGCTWRPAAGCRCRTACCIPGSPSSSTGADRARRCRCASAEPDASRWDTGTDWPTGRPTLARSSQSALGHLIITFCKFPLKINFTVEDLLQLNALIHLRCNWPDIRVRQVA